MPFSRRFYPKRLTVMCAYILRMGGPGGRTHYPGVTSAMLYQLSHRRTTLSYIYNTYIIHNSSKVWDHLEIVTAFFVCRKRVGPKCSVVVTHVFNEENDDT